MAGRGAEMPQKEIRLAFVGMSNAGKTTAAKKLAEEAGFFHREVDADIGHALELKDISELAAWLGLPDSDGFADRQQRYLDLEETYTLARDERDGLILDTTGSIVHLPERALNTLHSMYTIVHFDVGDMGLKKMIDRFFTNPKPVVWGGFFSKAPGESPEDALRRCYPKLLGERLERFRTLAHVNIPVTEIDFSNGRAIAETLRQYV